MKIEKLPSGSYRIRQQYEGKRISLVFDHKPTKAEITKAMSDKLSSIKREAVEKGSLDSYANKYIDECRKRGISPSTIKGYCSLQRNTPEWFKKLDINTVTSELAQDVIDEYFETHSPKTTRLMYSLWHTVIQEYRKEIILSVKLPPMDKKYEYEPSTNDVKRILEYAEGTKFYLPLRLASIGLRRGELCAITCSDLSEDDVLTINKDLIVDESNKQVIKYTPKTTASNRRILIPHDIAELIRKNMVVYEGNMHSINEYLHKAQDALGIPRFRLHILRHFAAAYLHKHGFTSAQVEDYIGWERGSIVMRRVYNYNLDPEDSQKNIASVLSEI